MRTRLTALILVPTAVGVFLSGARVIESIASITAFERTEKAAEYAARIRDLTEALGQERDMAQWAYYRRTEDRNRRVQFEGRVTSLATELENRQKTVDNLLARVQADFRGIDASFGPRVVESVQQSSVQIQGLAEFRKEDPIRVAPYTSLITSLLQVHDELASVSDDPVTVGDMRGLSALAHAKEEASKQRVRLVIGAYDPRLMTGQELEDFVASRARQGERLAEFTSEAGFENVQLLNRTLTNPQRYRAELAKARAIAIQAFGGRIAQGDLLSDVAQWFEDNSVTIGLVSEIEDQVAEDVLAHNQSLAAAEQRTAAITGASILLLLLLVLALTVLIARSMVSPLRRLRTEALEIAGFRLPNVVRDMRITGDATPPEVQPISVDSGDEIGEVAQAFDEVHRQAVRLAAEEAELRGNISSMFVNLSRRTQTLVERQISLIDGLEKGEEDSKRLGDLFKLDHLATRMRRNSENLLVLAGHEPARRRSQPAKLVDVVRASLSEVEDYERVQIKVHRTTSVVGSAANDIVHLVAELVENAIQFSPRNTQVTVSSSLIEGGGALLSITDQGIGMTDEELAEANRRLAEPPVVDVSVSRRMGLFVVGRLALRHGIRVQLRQGEGNGLIAMVLIPPALIVDSSQTSASGTSPWQQQAETAASTPPPVSQGFGPFQPAGQGAPAGLFGAEPTGRRQAFDQPSFDQPSFDPGTGRRQPVGPRGFGGPSDSDPSFRDPFGSQASDPFRAVDPFNSHAGDPYTSQSVDPFVSQSGDPFGRGPAGQGGFGRPDPRDVNAFGRSPGVEQQGFGQPGPSGPSGPSGPGLGGLPRRQPGSGFGGPEPAGGGFPSRPSEPYRGEAPRAPFSPWISSDEDPITASMPAVEVSPLEAEAEEEYLPIFASVESAWFRRAEVARRPEEAAQAEAERAKKAENERLEEWESARAAVSGRSAPNPDEWHTPADEGWRAAAAAAEPALGGITAAGLPKRTPKANLVPGRVAAPSAAPAPAPVPPLSAERVRNRMASLQQGVRRGRAEVREEAAGRADREEG